MTAASARATTPENRLFAHLCTHLKEDYARAFLEEILEVCTVLLNRPPTTKGKPSHPLDHAIASAQSALSAHHERRRVLSETAYRDAFLKLCSMVTTRGVDLRKRGRPKDATWEVVVRFLNDHYPVHIARTSPGKAGNESDFATTVRMMLGLAGCRHVPADITDRVFDTLRRDPPNWCRDFFFKVNSD